jgi:predicted nucleic acid-binding Zn ribbon protein
MPTYVYKFIDTGETIEVQQAFTDDALTHAKHPATGKKLKVKKVFTPVGVTFRGGGFYKTDSRNGKSKSTTTTATDSSSSSSSESKSSDSGKSGDAGKSDSGKSDSGKSDSGSKSSTPAASSSTPSKTASTSD